MSTETTSTQARRAALPTWLIATISGAFGLIYALLIWNAVTLLAYQAGGVFGLNGLGWFVLLFATVFPVIAFAVAFAIGWRRRAGELALVLLAGLAIAVVFWLNVLAYAYAYGASLLG